jgi:hypothetical protein
MTLSRFSKALLLAFSALGCCLVWPATPQAAVEYARGHTVEYESLLADGARPLGAAVSQLETLCRCVITYEDRLWRREDVQDLPGHAPGRETPKVPKGNAFMFRVRRDLETQNSSLVYNSLAEILAAFEQKNEAGVFHIRASDGVLHVAPNDALLDHKITMERENLSLREVVRVVLDQVSASTHQTIKFGTIPLNIMKAPVTIGAKNEQAADVLSRAFSSSHQKLSWRLLYDYGYQSFYFAFTELNSGFVLMADRRSLAPGSQHRRRHSMITLKSE